MTAFGNLAEQFVRSAASAPLAFTTRPSGSNGRTPAPYLVNFYALDGSVELTAMMGDGPATLTGGVGGWQEEVRHGAAPVTWWDAPAAYRQSIPLMFYGSASQEGAIQALYRLARPGPHGRPPPAVMIAGQAIWRADIVWVIEGIDPGTKVRRRASDGQVTRHDFTVRLLQYGETKIQDIPFERTIEGASTVTLALIDPDGELLDSGLFSAAVDIELPSPSAIVQPPPGPPVPTGESLGYRLVSIKTAGAILSLEFEDREVSAVRAHKEDPARLPRRRDARRVHPQPRARRQLAAHPLLVA
jgi:hypothetical protein